MSWMRPGGALLLLLGALAFALVLVGDGAGPVAVLGALFAVGLGAVLLAEDARRSGAGFPWASAAGTVIGAVLIAVGLIAVALGLILLILIITAPVGLMFMAFGLVLVVLGGVVAGASWLPWARRRRYVMEAEVVEERDG